MLFACSCSREKTGAAQWGRISIQGTEGRKCNISDGPSKFDDSSMTQTEIGSRDSGLIIKKARLVAETQDNGDILRVVAEGQDRKGNPVQLKYEWLKNNEYASDSDTISGFKRGDKISVGITPFDGRNFGQTRTLTSEIKSCTPKLTESKEVSFDGKTLIYQVKAVDPGGDQLTYSLIDPPEGMVIDKDSGLIKWLLSENASGSKSVKVDISNTSGGKLIYTLNYSPNEPAK
jgi:hypothetical protein